LLSISGCLKDFLIKVKQFSDKRSRGLHKPNHQNMNGAALNRTAPSIVFR
jgi:hypothetical protein